MKKGIIVLVLLGLIGFFAGSAYVSRRNQMVVKNEAIDSQWHQVEVCLLYTSRCV